MFLGACFSVFSGAPLCFPVSCVRIVFCLLVRVRFCHLSAFVCLLSAFCVLFTFSVCLSSAFRMPSALLFFFNTDTSARPPAPHMKSRVLVVHANSCCAWPRRRSRLCLGLRLHPPYPFVGGVQDIPPTFNTTTHLIRPPTQALTRAQNLNMAVTVPATVA